MQKLYDNEYGFSVERNNPFRVFRVLQEVAEESVGADQVIDLSRGDPGYGFAPGVRGREFFSFLLFLDTKLNNAKHLFVESKKEQEKQILDEIASVARSAYVPALSERYLKDLSEFIQRVIQIADEQGVTWEVYDVLSQIFNYSTVSGGTYHDPQGEKLVRMIVAWWHQKTIKTPLDYEDVVFTAGASHAIGTMFKLLGQEGLQYLNPGDKVMIASPVYSPYNAILERRGLEVLSISIDPMTGDLTEAGMKMLDSAKGVKLLLIIDPNNPSGFSMKASALSILAHFAKNQDALVMSDEVYASFFEDNSSILDLCPERTIYIQARSKIERSTGLRFGDAVITKQANKYLTEQMFKDKLTNGQDFKTAFIFAKGPGGVHGEFQHTTFVAGPAQYLGASHILLGEEEREDYVKRMVNNRDVFCEELGLPHKGNLYYIIFDLNEVEGCTKGEVPAEQKIYELAQRGVVLMPANLFFSEEDRTAKDRKNLVRASLANATPEKIRKAAGIIRKYLIG